MANTESNKGKLVLAFSGGLDTSYCAIYLKAKGYEVHAVAVNTGGFNENEVRQIEERARFLGVDHCVTLDETRQFYDECLK